MRKEKDLCPELSVPGRVKSRGLAICGEVEITLEAAQKYNGLFILPLIKRNEFGLTGMNSPLLVKRYSQALD